MFSNKHFDDLQQLLSCTKNNCDIEVTEIKITKQVSLLNNLYLDNNSYEFTPTGTPAGDTLLYNTNHVSYKGHHDLNI